MKTRTLTLAGILTVSAVLLLAGAAGADVITWAVDADGSWHDASNWDLNRVPAAGDDVVIDRSAGDYTVTVTGAAAALAGTLRSEERLVVSGGLALGADATVSDLEVSGTLTVEGELTVSGTFTWSERGALTGTGRIVASGGMVIDGERGRWLTGVALDNAGTAVWSSTGRIDATEGAVLRNLAGATIDVRNDALFNSSDGAFRNEGTFVKSGGGGTTLMNCSFDNRGTVRVETGTLFLGPGTHDGRFVTAAGTVLRLWESHDLGGSSIEAEGDVAFGGHSGSVTTMSGPYRVAGDSLMTANVALSMQGGTTGTLTLEPGGRLSVSDELTVSGTFFCAGGRVDSGAGKISALGGIAISTNLSLYGTIDNHATTTWSGGDIRVFEGGVFNNLAGSTFDIRTDGFMPYYQGVFNNDGVLRKSAGAGVATIHPALQNHGSVHVGVGTLKLSGGGSATGPFTGAAGTTLHFGGGTFDLSATAPITSQGDVVFNGASAVVRGAYAVDGATVLGTLAGPTVTLEASARTGSLALAHSVTLAVLGDLVVERTVDLGADELHGTIAVDGTMTIGGLLRWMSGTLRGTGRIVANGGIEISGDTSKTIGDTITLDNSVACTWSGTGRIYGGAAGPTINNLVGATFDVVGDARFFGGDVTFYNHGSFVKSAGGGTTQIDQSFDNHGSVEVRTGTLALNAAFQTAGEVLIASGATLSRAGDYTQTDGTTTLEGGTLAATGKVDVQGGILEGRGTIDASLANAGSVWPGGVSAVGVLAVTGDYSGSGVLEIEIGGTSPGVEFDQLVVSGCATFGSGSTLVLVRLDDYVPDTGDVFLVMPYTSYSGAFTGVTGAQITPVKAFVPDYDAAGGLTLTVEGDDTPPVIGSITADPAVLWPPDHKLKKEVTVSVEVSDDSGDPVTLSVEVSSSEGTNEHEPDWEILSIDSASGEIVVELRAERDGNAPGRVYTITVTATDSSGNQATASVEVLVPHDQG